MLFASVSIFPLEIKTHHIWQIDVIMNIFNVINIATVTVLDTHYTLGPRVQRCLFSFIEKELHVIYTVLINAM